MAAIDFPRAERIHGVFAFGEAPAGIALRAVIIDRGIEARIAEAGVRVAFAVCFVFGVFGIGVEVGLRMLDVQVGVTLNPRRKDLLDAVSGLKGLPIISMEELAARAKKMSGPTDPVATTDRIIGVVEWRDGTVIDVVRQLKK